MKVTGLLVQAYEQVTGDNLRRKWNLILRKAMQNKLDGFQTGQIDIHDYWGSWSIGKDDYLRTVITVHDESFYSLIFMNGSNGVADAYRQRFWSCSSLKTLFQILIRNTEQLDAMEQGFAKLGVIKDRLLHALRANTRGGSYRNIRYHYDLGNDLFELFLDETMTYSSGVFESEESSLLDASTLKLDIICRKMGLNAQHRIVEIGSGWGSFSIHAATHYGCHVTTVTISKEQHDLAKQRIDAAGLQDNIDLRLMDYRGLQGEYDRLVSIEMIEAVGHQLLPDYFNKCASLLKADGQMCIQVITMPDYRYESYLQTPDFIQRYIFPGSCCPSMAAIASAVAATSDLKITHIEDYAPDYARTLQCWLANFNNKREQLLALGYSESFCRVWEYYLDYCTAGFSERYLGLHQLVMNKPGCRRQLNSTHAF